MSPSSSLSLEERNIINRSSSSDSNDDTTSNNKNDDSDHSSSSRSSHRRNSSSSRSATLFAILSSFLDVVTFPLQNDDGELSSSFHYDNAGRSGRRGRSNGDSSRGSGRTAIEGGSGNRRQVGIYDEVNDDDDDWLMLNILSLQVQ